MKVPYYAPERQLASIQQELEISILSAFRSGDYIYSPIADAFEEKLADYCGAKYAITVASGTDALILALIAAGVKPGDEVITSAFSFFSTVGAITWVGAVPTFVDVDDRTFNLDARQLENVITLRTKAIVPVHLYGQMADMNLICAIGSKHRLVIIEDAAQAIGSTHCELKAGSVGTMGCLSFNPSKILSGFGNGGAILTSDRRLRHELRLLRNYGLEGYFQHSRIGINSRLSSLQAAAMMVELDVLDEWIESRNTIAHQYDLLLNSVNQVHVPYIDDGKRHVYHKYTIIAEQRDNLKSFLEARGIETHIYYPIPLQHQPCFSHLTSTKAHLPKTDEISKKVLSLPIFPGLTQTEVNYICEMIFEFYA